MKTVRFLALILVMMCLTGCEGALRPSEDIDVSEPKIEATVTPDANAVAPMTGMNGYDILLDMKAFPEKYMGKSVEISGMYTESEMDGGLIYSCWIQSPDGSEMMNLEFMPGDGVAYPADFPCPGDTITVIGVVGTYMLDGKEVVMLKNAEMKF